MLFSMSEDAKGSAAVIAAAGGGAGWGKRKGAAASGAPDRDYISSVK